MGTPSQEEEDFDEMGRLDRGRGGGSGRGSPTYIAPVPCVSTLLLALVDRAILIKGGVEGGE